MSNGLEKGLTDPGGSKEELSQPHAWRTTILVFHDAAAEYAEPLRAGFPDVKVLAGSDPDTLSRHMPEAEILIAAHFPLKALDTAQKLRWIQCTNVGVDFLLPARDRLSGITVTNARGIHGQVMADYAIGVITMLHWDFPQLTRDQAARAWRPKEVEPLASKTVGIVGLGAVGREVAQRAKTVGMTVLGVRREHGRPAEGVDKIYSQAGIREFLARCDFVVLAVPATPETRGMIGRPELKAMKRTAFLVNMARGSVVVEADLATALANAEIAGAALDVFEQEPLPDSSPLWSMPNVIITPHIAGYPADYDRRVLEVFSENLKRYFAGKRMLNVVDFQKGY